MQARRATPAFPAPSPTGPISSTTPANPTAKPATLAQVIRSPGTKTMGERQHQQRHHRHRDPGEARAHPLLGPAEEREGQRVREEPHADAMQPDPPPAACLWAGNPWPVAKANASRITAAMPIRPAAIQQRPEPRRAPSRRQERAAPDQPEEDEEQPGERRRGRARASSASALHAEPMPRAGAKGSRMAR